MSTPQQIQKSSRRRRPSRAFVVGALSGAVVMAIFAALIVNGLPFIDVSWETDDRTTSSISNAVNDSDSQNDDNIVTDAAEDAVVATAAAVDKAVLKAERASAKAKKEAAVEADAERGPPVPSLEQREAANQQLRAANLRPRDFTYDVNWRLADRVNAGQLYFSDANPHTSAEFVRQLKQNRDVFRLVTSNFGITRAQALDTEAWVPAQSLKPLAYPNGMAYDNNGQIEWGNSLVDPAGVVLWVNTHATKPSFVRGACFNVTNAPEKTDKKPTYPMNPPKVTPPKETPPKVTPPKEQPPKENPPKEQPKKVQRCDVTTKQIVTITTEQAKNTERYVSVDSPLCKEVPPPPPPKKVQRCDVTTKQIVTITTEQAKNTERYVSVDSPLCKDTPPPPPPKKPKCTDTASHDDGVCGTPDSGAEQQPVQDNDPKLVAPTKGYTPGDAEQNAEEQGPPCSGSSCGDEPTKSGTEVADSTDGGKAPAPPVVEPPDTSPTNPDADGTPHTENPDLGTSDPVDTPAQQDENPNNPSADNNSGDPGAGVDLPNVP